MSYVNCVDCKKKVNYKQLTKEFKCEITARRIIEFDLPYYCNDCGLPEEPKYSVSELDKIYKEQAFVEDGLISADNFIRLIRLNPKEVKEILDEKRKRT